MEPSFEKLLAALADGDVRFLLVGGLAVALNGYVRLTEDVDILLDLEEENVRRLIAVLADFGEGHGGGMSPGDITPEPGAVTGGLSQTTSMTFHSASEMRGGLAHAHICSGNVYGCKPKNNAVAGGVVTLRPGHHDGVDDGGAFRALGEALGRFEDRRSAPCP